MLNRMYQIRATRRALAEASEDERLFYRPKRRPDPVAQRNQRRRTPLQGLQLELFAAEETPDEMFNRLFPETDR